MGRHRRAGFTLIELLVTVGIAAVLLMLALPSFTAALRSNRVSSATNLTLASLNLARAEALRSKTSGRVCPAPASSSSKTCGTDWSKGLLVWTDENNDKKQQESETKRIVETPREIQIAMDPGATSEIVFDDRGRTLNRTTYKVIVKPSVCNSSEETRRSISVSGVGRVQVTREKCV
ncbi:GspH/FimT family pseudopilin [Lysobacter enzymogenes]|uniref:GspH/FimT family pseudopilin n=1 Tax=Lysobacter enzymogenes TaxID=69 RepID=UPI00384D5964